MRRRIRELAAFLFPNYWHRRYVGWATPTEPEIAFLPALVTPSSIVVDVGANRGLFVHHLQALGGKVVAFEPVPTNQAWLRRIFGPSLRLEPVALADKDGMAEIRNPVGVSSVATLSSANGWKRRKAKSSPPACRSGGWIPMI